MVAAGYRAFAKDYQTCGVDDRFWG
jgi:hypothetical protein